MDIPWGVDEWFTGALSVGAKGAVGSSFNFAPALYQKLMKAFAEGDVETARDCQWKSVQYPGLQRVYGLRQGSDGLAGR